MDWLKAEEIGVISGQLVPIGRVVAASDEPAKRAVPIDIEVLPYPTWETDYGPFVTDDQCQKDCVDYFDRRRTKLVIDYEHQTTTGEVAPAAGFVPRGKLYAAKERGLRAGSIEWNRRAKGFLEEREYEYHSPVALFNKKTKRVFAVLSIALTNTPATQNQTPLSEQIAAKAISEYAAVMAKGTTKGGNMLKEIYDLFRYSLGLKITDTVGDLVTSLKKIVTLLEKYDATSMLIEGGDGVKAAGDKKTLAEMLGLSDVAASAPAPPVAACAAVCDVLGVAPDSDVATVTAKILEFKHPADMVPRAELEAVQAKLAAVDETTSNSVLEEIIASNRTRITPALEPEIRAYYKKEGAESTRTLVAKLPEQAPKRIAGDVEPAAATSGGTAVARMKLRDGTELPVDTDSAALVASIETFQRENKITTYAEAARRFNAQRPAAS